MFLSIWSMGADAFAQNTAAMAMIYIMFYALGSFIILGISSAIGKLKMAATLIASLGAIACLYVFLKEAVKLIDYAGKVLGI